MSLSIQPNKQQALKLGQQLALLAMPPKKRTRLLKQLGRIERTKARKRIRSQQTVEGAKFAPRKDGRKKKILKKMGKTLEPYVIDANRLELKHKAALTGRIAALHQLGGSEKMTSGRMGKIHGKPDYDEPASRTQSKALVAAGYKVRKAKGKGFRRASLREISARLNQGQAGLILRKLRGKTSRNSWDIEVDARAFLGDTPANVQNELVKLMEQARG